MSGCVRRVLPLRVPLCASATRSPCSSLSTFLQQCGPQEHRQKRFSATVAVETKETARPISEMPGPINVPVLGSIPAIILGTFSMFKRGNSGQVHVVWEFLTKRYGPIARFKFPAMPPMVSVTRPEDIEKMFRATMDNPIRQAFHSLRKVRYETPGNYFEEKGGLLIENNEEWWRVRSKVQAPMMKPKNLAKYIPQMDQVTLDFIERMVVFQKEFGEMPSNFQQELYKWALESVSLVALNRRLGCLRPDIPANSPQIQLINTVNNIFEYLNITEMGYRWWKLFRSPTFKKLEEGHHLFLRIAETYLLEAEASLKEKYSKGENDAHDKTLLETLLQREGLSRKDVVTIILDMLFAGIDTTSHTLGFTLYLLARNPKAQKRLQEEVDSVLGDGKGPITESHLARLSFLKSCVKESLRIFPIAIGNARMLTEDVVLSGYNVPKGHMVFAVNYITSKDEQVFPRASEFLPERWQRDQPLGPIHPFASLPFSHGPRMCIGRRIAEQEMYIFLARVMHRFNVLYKYKDMKLITRLVSLPSEPLKFEFIERR